MFGRRAWMEISGRTTPTGIGYILTMDGHGLPIMHGAGRRFTTEGGSTMMIMAGCGFLVMIGLPHGLPGAMLETIIVGRP